MRVLLLTQVLPYPPNSGPQVKTWNVLKHLTRRHDVTLVSFVRGDQSEAVSRLARLCTQVHTVPINRSRRRDLLDLARSVISRRPFVIARDDRDDMRRLVDELSANNHFDVVHADQLNMAQYALRVPGARRILDAHNALWLATQRLCHSLPAGPAKLLAAREWRQLHRYEGSIAAVFDTVLAVCETDKQALLQAAGRALRIHLVPIAIDTDEVRLLVRHPDADRILHLATLLWPPNVDGLLWFLRDVLPRVQARRPQVGVDVVGLGPPSAVRAAARADTHVQVTGYVADLKPFVDRAAVMVVPLRAGAGMRVRILNGLAQGLPIVTTSIGCEGIAAVHERHLLIADTPEAFAESVVRLLTDQVLARGLALNGRQLVEEEYDCRSVFRQLDEVYAAVGCQ